MVRGKPWCNVSDCEIRHGFVQTDTLHFLGKILFFASSWVIGAAKTVYLHVHSVSQMSLA